MAKQPSPRTLSPEIPVVSYPTPNISDLMVVQDVDTRLPGYVAAEYGDLHPDQVSYPGLKLVYQTPLDNESNYMWVRRVYSKDRTDQDTYNYAIKYAGSDPNFPTYIRTYTLLRSEYQPLGRGAVDPLFPTAPNGNDVVLNTEEVERYKDDTKESELDSLYVKVTRVYITLPGPTIFGGQVDSRYGIPISVEKQAVPAGVGPSVTYVDGVVRSSDIEPVDTLQSNRMTSVLSTLPNPQVWYGRRAVTELPPVLTGAELVGTEQLAFVPHYKEIPSSPLLARYTRTFSYGPPTEQDAASNSPVLSPQTFNLVLEYSSSRVSESLSTGSSVSSSSQVGSSSSTQSGASSSAQSGASSSTQSGASASTQSGASASTQSGASASTQSGASSSTQSGASSSTQSGASASTQSGASSSTQSGASASTQSGASASTQSGSNASTSSGSRSSASSTSGSSASGESSTTWTHAGPGAVLTNDPVSSQVKNSSGSTSGLSSSVGQELSSNVGKSTSSSTGKSTSSSTGKSTSSSTGQSTSSSTGKSTSSSTGKSTSSSTGKSTSSSTGKSTSSSTGKSTSSSTGKSTSSSTGKSTSSSTGKSTSSSTGKSTSSSTGVSLSQTSGTSLSQNSGLTLSSSKGLSQSQSAGLSASKSLSSSLSSSHSRGRSTSKSLLSVQLPRCLRAEIQLTGSVNYNGGVTEISATIPATSPNNLPWGDWYEVGTRNSEHWKYGIWVTEKVEVQLPDDN